MQDSDSKSLSEMEEKTPYHTESIKEFSFLITGGAGFIGSNIVEYLFTHGAGYVKVLDNLSTGSLDNIREFMSHPNFEFIEGDIRDYSTCKLALEGIDYVSHQAALGSVPRSINDPITTNAVNINGFLNMLDAVRNSMRVKRMIYAASSSTYGDSIELPKTEGREGKPLSPYAVTKAVNELYADVFSKVYGLHTIGLRYFNVFGPKQSPTNAYAAVIPLFCNSFIKGVPPIINGDGGTSRDFTFIENAVQANIKALLKTDIAGHVVYNVACGNQTSLNEVVTLLQKISGKSIAPVYQKERAGDIRHSLANIEKIKNELDYHPAYQFEEGLKMAYNWYSLISK
jgi:UDP-N-acetylglucosamine 4-epimerase